MSLAKVAYWHLKKKEEEERESKNKAVDLKKKKSVERKGCKILDSIENAIKYINFLLHRLAF